MQRNFFGFVFCFVILTFIACKQGSTEKEKGVEQAKSSAANPQLPPQPAKPAVLPKPEYLAGAHILVAYKGAMRAAPTITRTKEEALKLAQEISEKVSKEPKKFADLAKKHSDDPSASMNSGSLGAWPKGRMVPAFDQAISNLKVGEISKPVETQFGYHVLKRDELPPQFAGSHILIAYKGAMRAADTVTRTKKEAKELAEKLAKEAKANPSKFEEMAVMNSNCSSAAQGGKLGVWQKGRMVPEFDVAIEKLKIGEVSDVIETKFGFHVIKREPLPNGQ